MECSEEDICTIAEYDFDWRRVGRRLIGDQKTTNIDNERCNEENKRDRMLLKWKESKARDATFGALVKVLRDLGNKATADRVKELERKKKCQGNNTSHYPMVKSPPGAAYGTLITRGGGGFV